MSQFQQQQEPSTTTTPPAQGFVLAKHARYFMSALKGLTYHYASNDQNRLMMAHFCIHALDLMGILDKIPKADVVEWIYSLQVEPESSGEYLHHCGFRGSPSFRREPGIGGYDYDSGHIAMTYTALVSLRALGDDYSRVHRAEILQALRALQQDDGSFTPVPDSNERDMRFVFCACAISAVLDDWSGVDRDKIVEYVRSCLSYDGGVSLVPGQESHADEEKEQMVLWCLQRQVSGFQGRSNKDPDTCYSFWVGATLKLLGEFHLIDVERAKAFHLECQNLYYGGFCKCPESVPDVLHAFYTVCFLSMVEERGLRVLDAALAVRVHEG